MNVLAVCADTFRADHLGCYGNDWIRTPRLDALAHDGIVFEQCYAEGLPTLPARRIFFTGRRLFPRWEVHEHKGDRLSFQPAWHAIPDDEPTVAELLADAGVTCGLVTDLYHYFKPSGNYHRGFDAWEFVRGQEADRWRSGPREALAGAAWAGEAAGDFELSSLPPGQRQYLLNNAWRRREEDYLAPRVMTAAMRWLEDNAGNRPFFLWVDCFDPHEPWDPPLRDAAAYADAPHHPRLIFAPATDAGSFSEAEAARIRALYAGEVSLVDRWVGRLLDRLADLGLADETAVLFTSDHGTLLGEMGLFHKQPWALVQPETRLPLILRLPYDELAGVRVHDYVSAIDVAPTVLVLLDHKEGPQHMDGQDLVPVALRKRKGYPHLVSAYGPYASLRTRTHNYVAPYRDLADTRWAKSPQPPRLFALDRDLCEQDDVLGRQPDVAADLQARLDRVCAGVHDSR